MALNVNLRLAVLAMFLASCGVQRLRDVVDPADLRENLPIRAMLEAPIVVVGTVKSVETAGGIRPSSRPGISVQALLLRIGIENVLAGAIDSGDAEYTYFTAAASEDRTLKVVPHAPAVGRRFVFFLRREGGRLRSMKDVANYTVPVFSGSHARTSAPAGLVGRKISWVLLTEGEGVSGSEFVDRLPDSVAVSLGFASYPHVEERLRALTRSDSEPARIQAAELLRAITTR